MVCVFQKLLHVHSKCFHEKGTQQTRAANRKFSDMTNNTRSQPKPSSYTGTRVFHSKSYAQAASVEGNGKARYSRGNTHSRSSLARQKDCQARDNVGNEASFGGTRFSTTVESVKSVLSNIVPLDSESLQATKSVRRNEG